MLRAVNAELSARPPHAGTRPAGTLLAWAAAVLLAVPAALYFKGRVAPPGSTTAGDASPVTRGGEAGRSALAITSVVTAAEMTPLPRRAVLVEIPVPETAAGERVELRLLDPGGRERLREADLPVQQRRGRLALDASALDAGTWRIEVRLVAADETVRATVSYALAVPAP